MATVYDLITERIVEKLQQGTIPWQKPWNSAAGLPRNLSSQKPYRGINVWMLGSAGYTLPLLADLQASQRDWRLMSVRASKGFPSSSGNGWKEQERLRRGEESRTPTRRVPLARLYHVFNVQQCELPARLQPFLQIEPENPDPQPQIAACEQILAAHAQPSHDHPQRSPGVLHASPGHRQHARCWALPQSRALLLRAVS